MTTLDEALQKIRWRDFVELIRESQRVDEYCPLEEISEQTIQQAIEFEKVIKEYLPNLYLRTITAVEEEKEPDIVETIESLIGIKMDSYLCEADLVKIREKYPDMANELLAYSVANLPTPSCCERVALIEGYEGDIYSRGLMLYATAINLALTFPELTLDEKFHLYDLIEDQRLIQLSSQDSELPRPMRDFLFNKLTAYCKASEMYRQSLLPKAAIDEQPELRPRFRLIVNPNL